MIGRPARLRLRFRIRSLMLAVVLVSLPLGLWSTLESRRARFERLAQDHRSQMVGRLVLPRMPGGITIFPLDREGRIVGREQSAIDMWHALRARDFDEAARAPWRREPPAHPFPGRGPVDRPRSSGRLPSG